MLLLINFLLFEYVLQPVADLLAVLAFAVHPQIGVRMDVLALGDIENLRGRHVEEVNRARSRWSLRYSSRTWLACWPQTSTGRPLSRAKRIRAEARSLSG